MSILNFFLEIWMIQDLTDLWPVVLVYIEDVFDQVSSFFGTIFVKLQVIGQDCLKYILGCFSFEWFNVMKELIEEDSNGPDVYLIVVWFQQEDLWSHVHYGATEIVAS